MEFNRLDLPPSDQVNGTDNLNQDAITALTIYGTIDFDLPDDLAGLDRQLALLEHFDDQTCFVARDDRGEICAVANVDESRPDGTLWVHGLAVDCDMRNEGIGHEFAEYLTDLAIKQGRRRIGSRAVLSSVRFHLNEGFVQADNNLKIPLMYKYL